MSEPENQAAGQDQDSAIERGTYEIIRDRLLGHAKTLGDKAQALNQARLDLFGGAEMTVIGNERIRTENNCVPRDIAEIAGRLLFGYNVFLGLKRETAVADVFSMHSFEETAEGGFVFDRAPPDFIADPRFVADFDELYQFYKSAKLLQLRDLGSKLLAVFQIGASVHDVKVFQWAVYPDGKTRYIDNRGERDHVFPSSHDFEWTVTTRDMHVSGQHPHVNILDDVFVETVGGDLTVKVEDNTGDGLGIYREPVDDPDQSLDDGEIHFAKVGVLILLKILPYREQEWRYLVFNTRTRSVDRIDAIGRSCLQLPEDHGIIFPGGYYLQSGETKSFAVETDDVEFLRMIRSPNGEDVLYVFYRREEGSTILLPYNMIRKEVQNPIQCSGYSRFDDGKTVVFRTQEEPTRIHPMQIWQTPFTSDEFAAKAPSTGSYLEKVGNADLVCGISDALSLRRAVEDQQPSVRIYEDIIAAATRMVDTYYWLDHQTVDDMLASIKEVRTTAELIVDEFEKVEQIRRQAREAADQAEAEIGELISDLRPEKWDDADLFVKGLGDLRRQRGHLITLREMRYADLERLERLEAEVVEEFDKLSNLTVEFMAGGEALQPYHGQIDQLVARIDSVEKVTEATPLLEELDDIGGGMQLLTDVVGGLEISDATVRTSILEGISEVLGSLNRARALMENQRKELMSGEAVAEFGAQFKVFSQGVTSALGLADDPDKCDSELSRLMLAIEDMESRFSEFDKFLEQLGTKREEVYEAFSSKKQMLLDQRQRRANHMMQAAERILESIRRRSSTFSDVDELNSFFAADPMVGKVRDLSEKLRGVEDTVKADEIESRLKSTRQEAARALRDRKDIYEEGTDVIKLGKHRFSVNTQPLDLTMVPRDGVMALHLTGTDFHELIDDQEFAATADYWEQEMVSETSAVYRGEYLAACILADAESEQNDLSLDKLNRAALDDKALAELVRARAAQRYDEGYERGLHDADAALILAKLLDLYSTAGLLRFAPAPRALGCLFWAFFPDDTRSQWQRRAQSLLRLRKAFAHSPAIIAFIDELSGQIGQFYSAQEMAIEGEDARMAAAYLLEELGKDTTSFVTSAAAVNAKRAFLSHLQVSGNDRDFEEDLRELENDLPHRHELTSAWVRAFMDQSDDPEVAENRHVLPETVVLLLTEAQLSHTISHALTTTQVEGLLGNHARIEHRTMSLRLDEFLSRLAAFRCVQVPGFRNFQQQRHQLLERERSSLRLSEYMPKVMSAFVRNRLINEVYLPLIGDNLAKQMGALGAGKRTDLMGMLLLISPPGYGKTTLMEYIANRFGLVFMKVNGPSLGHSVTSLDPAEAPNATARIEVNKTNLAFEMANNVLLYLDDIQHTASEFLQKFISLCDAQRKVEGVWKDQTRTYDLRGKKFCICMAGNPYTESGERFQIPDMLANRADTYNLGDILEGKDDLFALSYIENSLTSNSTLAPLSTRDPEDLYKLVRMAAGEDVQADQLKHPYSGVEMGEIISVLEKLITVQGVLLQVNLQYIHSASQDDAFRTEPRFQLQGSYRNMNKITEKIVPVMNDAELEALIDDHYVGEAQTLTTGAEHNLLKLAELRGKLTPEQAERWDDIKRSFGRVQAMGGGDDDPVARVTGTLGLLSDRLGDIGKQIVVARESAAEVARETAASRAAQASAQASALASAAQPVDLGEALVPYMAKLQETLIILADVQTQIPTEVTPLPPAAPPIDPETVGQMAQRLGGVCQGLESIGQAIAGATRIQAEAAAEAKALPAAAPPPVQATGPAGPAPDIAPYLAKLTETMAAFAKAPPGGGGGTTIIQNLQPGVLDLLNQMEVTVERGLLEALRSISRWLKSQKVQPDQHVRTTMERTLKNVDMLKDLLKSLKKIDTGGLTGKA